MLLLPDRFLRRALILGVRGYQIVLGPILGGHCRFTPTCSTYAIDALRFLPSWKAVPAILWRIARCQPLCKGGFDFVDPKPSDLKWRLPEAR